MENEDPLNTYPRLPVPDFLQPNQHRHDHTPNMPYPASTSSSASTTTTNIIDIDAAIRPTHSRAGSGTTFASAQSARSGATELQSARSVIKNIVVGFGRKLALMHNSRTSHSELGDPEKQPSARNGKEGLSRVTGLREVGGLIWAGREGRNVTAIRRRGERRAEKEL
ncbi:hypothetical protein BC936DRAFT_140137 [Jimgerdemannia flammicorona]|uniref:Uncharacterized protein n=1 Tax=Jimgerdemannia flammicorona TaxID=994334 RepID=A0A433B062_9FUNG|nr:hypothetical protein BC936DRAFT_140137 [Jimgerdemannia flammicorona]